VNARALVLALGVAGCATVGPEFERPDTAAVTGDRFVRAGGADAAEALPAARWWTRYGDPATDALVARALTHNLDLKIAAANVLEAEALRRVQTGNRKPAVDAGLDAGRGFTSSDNGRRYTSNLRLAATVSWQADLYGRLRRSERAATDDLFAQMATRDALVQSLIAAVVRQRVAIAVAERRLALARAVVETRRRTLEIVERRYNQGVEGISSVDVRLARENLAAAESDVPAREQSVALAGHALDVLLGRKPGATEPRAVGLAEVPPLTRPALAVPAALVDQRPDLRAAEFRVAASTERIGVAIADLYPDLTLTGNAGWQGSEFSRFFSIDRLLLDIAGRLAMRLFDGGQREANIDAAKARLEAAAQSYAADVLDAVREVEDALVRERYLRERLAAIERRLESARAAETLARDRYGRGLESLLTVLETERRRRNAEDLLLIQQGLLWDARIDLHLALGGDWLEQDASEPAES